MVSIDRVYQTVQKILNKEQRGYLPPVEFNLFANQSQIEIFEQYFYDQATYMAGPMMDSDYADIVRNLEEKITFFDNVSEPLTEPTNDMGEVIRDGYYEYPAGFYRLGRVLVNAIHVDEVSHRDVTYINLSPLTAPTRKQPIYTRHEGGVVIYPRNGLLAADEVTMVYVRQPAEVAWGYRNVGGNAVFNTATTTNFELHPSELPVLILKICALAGVAVRAIDVTQIIQGEEQSLIAEQKQ